eukprot:529973-Pelagomonas_calceolata.AAC.1
MQQQEQEKVVEAARASMPQLSGLWKGYACIEERQVSGEEDKLDGTDGGRKSLAGNQRRLSDDSRNSVYAWID